MNEMHSGQARVDEIGRCREQTWLSIDNEMHLGKNITVDVGEYLGDVSSDESGIIIASKDHLIHLGQNVYLPNNQFIGLITKLFYDASGRISHLVIRTARIFGRYKLVPMQLVNHITSLSVQLSINHPQFKKLEKYNTDLAISEFVDQALWDDVVLRTSDYYQVNVRIQNGVAILNGHVTTSMMQWRVETAVKSAPGILGVRSYLISDDQLTMIVAEALGQIGAQGNCTFFPRVEHGLAVLTGDASSVELRDQAGQCVAEIPWVRGVINEIRVSGSQVVPYDQRFFQPLIGNELIFKDGLVARIQKVVINPHNRLVSAIIVLGCFPPAQRSKPGFALFDQHKTDELKVIPVGVIHQLTRNIGVLQMSSTETTRYKDFVSSCFIPPPQQWLPPYPYCANEVLFQA